MPAFWRWFLAMGFSVLMFVAGLIFLWRAGADYELSGWFILGLGVLSLAVNFVMRKQFR